MMRKIILSLTILLTLCGISNADFIYATSDGHLGTIKINSSSDIEAPSIQYRGTMSNSSMIPFLMSYWNGTTTRVMMIDRFATESGDRAYVFNPTDMSQCISSADMNGVYGTTLGGFADNGHSVFLAGFSTVYEVDTSSFRVRNSFDCSRVISRDGYDTETECLAVDSSLIHVVASSGERQKYMRFEGQLKTGVSSFLSADTSAGASAMMTTSNNWPIIGHSSGIDVMRSDKKFYRTISTDYPVKAMCTDSSGNLFYSTQYQDGDNYVNTISLFVLGTEFTPVTITSTSPNFRLLRDNSHKDTFAAMTDEGIRFITFQNGRTLIREYTASELGGTPVGIAAATVSGYNANSSSSGCNSGIGLVISALIFCMMRRK